MRWSRRWRAFSSLDPLGSELQAKHRGTGLGSFSVESSCFPDAPCHLWHEAVLALSAAEHGGETGSAEGRDLLGSEPELKRGLEMAAAQVGGGAKQLRPDELEQRPLLLESSHPFNPAPLPGLCQRAQLAPDRVLQAHIGEAEVGHQVSEEAGVALVGLVSSEIVELARPSEHEGLDDGIAKAESLSLATDHLPVVAGRFHGQDETAKALPLQELPSTTLDLPDASSSGRHTELAHARLVTGSNEDDHAFPLAEVDAGDERVRAHELRPACELGGSSLHATSNVHGESLLSGSGSAARIVGGLICSWS